MNFIDYIREGYWQFRNKINNKILHSLIKKTYLDSYTVRLVLWKANQVCDVEQMLSETDEFYETCIKKEN